MNTSDFTALIGVALGLFSFLGGVVLWYKGSVEKRYAAERDFNHLRRNQEQMGGALATICKDIETLGENAADFTEESRKVVNLVGEIARAQIEMKAHILAISNRLEGLYARIDGDRSSGWRRE